MQNRSQSVRKAKRNYESQVRQVLAEIHSQRSRVSRPIVLYEQNGRLLELTRRGLRVVEYSEDGGASNLFSIPLTSRFYTLGAREVLDIFPDIRLEVLQSRIQI